MFQGLPHHTPGIFLDRPQLEREGLQRGGHVKGRGAGVGEHQPDERFLHRVRRACQLALQRLHGDFGHFEGLATDLLENFDHTQRADSRRSAQFQRGMARRRVVQAGDSELSHIQEGNPANRVLARPIDRGFSVGIIKSYHRAEPGFGEVGGLQDRIGQTAGAQTCFYGALGILQRERSRPGREGNVHKLFYTRLAGRSDQVQGTILIGGLRGVCARLVGERYGRGGGDDGAHAFAGNLERGRVAQVALHHGGAQALELLNLGRIRGGPHQGFDGFAGSGQPVSFGYDKLRALLVYLALEAAQPVRREKLAGLLWPDQSEQSAQDSLRQALSRLRQAIGDRQSERPPLLLIERETVQLPPSSEVWVDVRAFQETLARTDHHPHRHPQACETCAQQRRLACEYHRGDLLADLSLPDSDLFEGWAAGGRERLSQQAVEAFTQLIRYDEWKGDDYRLRQSILSLLKLDPWNETGHAAWIGWLIRSGQRSAAVSYYHKVRQTLNDELGIEPSPQLTAMYEKIKGDTGEFRGEAAPRRATGLPVPLTPLVGRRAELAELQAWLADPTRRLITVTGPGGVGKTRLVIAAVEQQASAFTDGAAFVSLVGTQEQSRLLAQRVAETIRLEEPGQISCDPKTTCWCWTASNTASPSAIWCKSGWKPSPRLVVLAASRQRLDLPGEWIFGLVGLEVPPPVMIAEAEQYSAVNLFVQRARQTSAGFELGPQNRGSTSEICRLVDGFPLAINLAAAWAATIPCEEIAHEIRRSLDILTARTESQDIHRSVRAVAGAVQEDGALPGHRLGLGKHAGFPATRRFLCNYSE